MKTPFDDTTLEVMKNAGELFAGKYFQNEVLPFSFWWEGFLQFSKSEFMKSPADLIWEADIHELTAPGALDEHDIQKSEILRFLGLLAILFAILQAKCLSSDSLNEVDLRESFQRAFDQMNPPTWLREATHQQLFPFLAECFGIELDESVLSLDDNIIAGRERWFVQRLCHSKLYSVRDYNPGAAKKLCTDGSYDIVVFEPERCEVLVLGKECSILDLSSLEKVLLKTVFENVGKALTHEDLKTFCGRPRQSDVYPLRSALAKLLGKGLRDRIMSESRNGKYYIHDSGWSYFWVRKKSDSSLLF